MVIRENDKGAHIPIISSISKAAYFLSTIPRNLKKAFSKEIRMPMIAPENRFNNLYGFNGQPNLEEKYLLLSRYDDLLNEFVVELINLKSFQVLHTWNPDLGFIFKDIHINSSGKWKNLLVNKSDDRFRLYHPILTKDGSLIFHGDSPLIKIDKNNDLVWVKDDTYYHHSLDLNEEGDLWTCVRYFPYAIDSNIVGTKYQNYKDDGIRKITVNGEILFDMSVSEILINNDMEYLLFAVTDNKFKRDPIHLNDIQPVEYDTKHWNKGDVFLSFRNLSLVILYRPSEDRVIWKSENNFFFNQHDVDIISDNRISIFDNNTKWFHSGPTVDGNNRIVIYDFDEDNYSYYLTESLKNEDVRTLFEGRSQILPNGDLFVEETLFGRSLYFNSDGSLRWVHINRRESGMLNRTAWSRILYLDRDIKNINKFLNTKSKSKKYD